MQALLGEVQLCVLQRCRPRLTVALVSMGMGGGICMVGGRGVLEGLTLLTYGGRGTVPASMAFTSSCRWQEAVSINATQPGADRGMWLCRGTGLTTQALTSPCKPHTLLSDVSNGQRVDHK